MSMKKQKISESREAELVAGVRKAVDALVTEKGCGPILIRLSWHDAGTYCKDSKTGGPRAVMRFIGGGECVHAANAGLKIAQGLLADIVKEFGGDDGLSTADIWSLAAVQAIETMGGPKVQWRSGRSDAEEVKEACPDGRLPDAAQGAQVRVTSGKN